MRKPFKIALYVLILPIVAFDFISYNINMAQSINEKYIQPRLINSTIKKEMKKHHFQSSENLCARMGCTSA